MTRAVVVERVKHILGLPNIIVQDEDHLALAVDWYEAGMDFADALHVASSSELEAFATFDKKILSQVEKSKIAQQIILLP